MSHARLSASLVLSLSLFGCGADDGTGEGPAGELGAACIGGVYCNGDLACVAGVCTEPGDNSGDGDAGSGETGDGDGEPADTGDGDGDPGAALGLYEGPCLTSDECEGDLWCAYANGRFWCAGACVEDIDCPAHASASAVPTCEFVLQNDGNGSLASCVLACETEAECPDGAQCFGSGLASKTWCGFL